MENLDKLILCTLLHLEDRMPYFGKIIVQKAFYFLKEVYEVEMPFSFSFYHYGPFSFDLQHELDRLELFGEFSIFSDPGGIGYRYQLTPEGREKAQKVGINDLPMAKIERAANFVKGKTPSELELLSTIHFAHKVHHPADEDELIGIVRYLKPRFGVDFVRDKVRFLRSEHMIT